MALPEFNMRQLLEAGVHFGHQTHRWNPKMGQYIFGDRNGVHIIDLSLTTPLLHQALVAVRDTVAGGGRVLFVGTKRQASEVIARSAIQCAQYYMNSRWLGGTLTNWKTISNSIKRYRELEEKLADEGSQGLTKKEILNLTRERDKLERAIGGIKDMGGIPDIMIVIDTNKEAIAIAEAHTLGIPVVAVLDSNCNPDGITYPIPGNDDATRSIELYCDLLSRAVIDGLEQGEASTGIDLGAQAEPIAEDLTGESEAQVAEAPAEKPEAQVAEAPAEKSEAQVAEAPAEKSEAQVAEAPAEKSEAQVAEAPAEKSEAQVAEAPAEKSEAQVAEAPAEKSEAQVAEAPAEKSEAQIAEAPAEKSEAQVAEAPAEKSEAQVAEAPVEKPDAQVAKQ